MLYFPSISDAVTIIVALPTPFTDTFPDASTLTTLSSDETYDNVAPVAGSTPVPRLKSVSAYVFVILSGPFIVWSALLTFTVIFLSAGF